MSTNTLLLVGVTGLVGGQCLRLAERDDFFAGITVLTRRPLPDPVDGRKTTVQLIDFDYLDRYPESFAASHVFCSLGTTIKKAGSRDNFYRVDYSYVYETARLALQQGAKHFYVVTALGSDARSKIFYYRVKGQVEEALSQLGYESLYIFRPSFILGRRAEKRTGEILAKYVALTLGALLPNRLKAVSARSIAMAMMQTAREGRPGRHIIDNAAIHTLAAKYEMGGNNARQK